jgi:hypothetical protein
MGASDEDKQKMRQYGDMWSTDEHRKSTWSTGAEAMQAQGQEGNGGVNPAAIGKIMSQKILAEAKAANTRESHAERTAQRQAAFELEEQRKDRKLAADIRREGTLTAQELQDNTAFTTQELTAEALKNITTKQKPQNEQ